MTWEELESRKDAAAAKARRELLEKESVEQLRKALAELEEAQLARLTAYRTDRPS